MEETILNISGYIARRYHELFGEDIDEMKLHKLLYFAQRESLIRYDRTLFDETLVAGKYGPLSIQVRDAFKANMLSFSSLKENADLTVSEQFVEENRDALGYVFHHFAPMSSWSLSNISHGERSWGNARIGIDRYSHEYREMSIDDIRHDAVHNKSRRLMLQNVFPRRYENTPYCL